MTEMHMVCFGLLGQPYLTRFGSRQFTGDESQCMATEFFAYQDGCSEVSIIQSEEIARYLGGRTDMAENPFSRGGSIILIRDATISDLVDVETGLGLERKE